MESPCVKSRRVKTCCHCHQSLPVERFSKRTRSPDGLQSRCKTCVAEGVRAWRQANPERDRASNKRYRDSEKGRARSRTYQRGSHFFKRYGITVEQYEAMVVEQEGTCPICCTQPEVLVVDHCHETGAVRGLLCGPCNTGIGMLADSPERLRAGALYIEKARV